VLDWRAPLSMTVSAFVMASVLWMMKKAGLVEHGADPLFGILSGGIIFGAVFMASDYTTAPLTAKGKVIFGAGAGIIAMLIREFGNYPEGASYGILIMNAATPFLNRLLQKKYGCIKPKKPAPAQGGVK
jgi:electron transport complex protein RnfD